MLKGWDHCLYRHSGNNIPFPFARNGAGQGDATFRSGFMWYKGQLDTTAHPAVIAAVGYGQQRLFIVNEDGISVVVLAGLYGPRRYREAELILRKTLDAQYTP